jgi:hypothetical protein
MRLVADDHDQLALLFNAGQNFLNFLGTDRQLVRETVIADKVMMADDLAFCAAAGASLIVFASRKIDAALLGLFHHSLRPQMRARHAYHPFRMDRLKAKQTRGSPACGVDHPWL